MSDVVHVKAMCLVGEGDSDDHPDLYVVVRSDAVLIDVINGEVELICEAYTWEDAVRIARAWNRENLI